MLVNHPLSVPSLKPSGHEGLRVSRGKHPEEPGREWKQCAERASVLRAL